MSCYYWLTSDDGEVELHRQNVASWITESEDDESVDSSNLKGYSPFYWDQYLRHMVDYSKLHPDTRFRLERQEEDDEGDTSVYWFRDGKVATWYLSVATPDDPPFGLSVRRSARRRPTLAAGGILAPWRDSLVGISSLAIPAGPSSSITARSCWGTSRTSVSFLG